MQIHDDRGNRILTLSSDEVINLHNLLSSDPEIAKITEVVTPNGVKDFNLLESAVNRQYSGFQNYTRYNNIYSNCATLVYGVACNHAFHNGNKRAALLSMIKHLYKNGYVILHNISNELVYEFLRSIAAHELESFARSDKEYRNLYNSCFKVSSLNEVEADVKFIELWIRRHSQSKNQTERPMRWKVLIEKLQTMGIVIETDPVNFKVVLTKQSSNLFSFFEKNRGKYSKTYPYEFNKLCEKYLLKEIRKDFGLTKDKGYDDYSFFVDADAFVESEILLFKKAIYKLSRN